MKGRTARVRLEGVREETLLEEHEEGDDVYSWPTGPRGSRAAIYVKVASKGGEVRCGSTVAQGATLSTQPGLPVSLILFMLYTEPLYSLDVQQGALDMQTIWIYLAQGETLKRLKMTSSYVTPLIADAEK
jgi:hypothetical protein